MAARESLDEYGYPLRPDSRRWLRSAGVQISKRLLLSAIYLALSLYGLVLRLRTLPQRRNPLAPPAFRPQRILVIRLDLIGDLVLTLTLVHLLKRIYPQAEIDLLAMPSTAPIARSEQDLSEIITYDPNVWRRPQALLRRANWREARTLLRRLRARHYDLAISASGPWAAVIAALSGARRRVGFAREGYPGFMSDPVPGRHWQRGDHRHEVDYCLELARAAGASPEPEDRIPHLTVDPAARDEVEALLSRARPGSPAAQAHGPLVVCHLGSHNGYAKRWPLPYWARLIDRLAHELDARIVLTGTSGDLPIIEAVLGRTRMASHALNLAGQTSLTQLAALMHMADLVISGDSGPMHIAAAVGAPLIAIHGPTDPALSGPISPQATVLRSTIWCSPCYDARHPADCRFHSVQCMKNVTPEEVFTAAQTRLGQRSHVSLRQEQP
jgi:lipopolysaccharide heptosyltransferase II